nr:MAG TPA: hypothetical protein [Caudoviricetes sp.]DAR16315.1 MAG TPA: hypothetical protein [Caudoviricetes sp.]DAS22262.1 MAG TPA: hypothetical protein [Caudoviricetes sp.]
MQILLRPLMDNVLRLLNLLVIKQLHKTYTF